MSFSGLKDFSISFCGFFEGSIRVFWDTENKGFN